MPQLPVLSGREAAKVFERAGFGYDHHTGSHMIYYHPDGRHLSIPDHRELDRGTLRSLVRRSGLSLEEFLRLVGRD